MILFYPLVLSSATLVLPCCHYDYLTDPFHFFPHFLSFFSLALRVLPLLNLIRSTCLLGFVRPIPLSKTVSLRHVVLMQVIATDPIKFTDWCHSLKSCPSLSISSILFDFFVLVAIYFHPFFLFLVPRRYDCYSF